MLGGQLGLEYGDYSTRKLDARSLGRQRRRRLLLLRRRSRDRRLQRANRRYRAARRRRCREYDDAREARLERCRDAALAARRSRHRGASRVRRLLLVGTFSTVHDCSATTDQQIYKLSAEHSTGSVSNTFGFSTIDVVRDDFTEGARSFGSEGEIKRVEYTGSYKASEATTFVYGLDFHDEKLIDDDGPSSRDQKGYYVEYQGALGDAFFLSLGARYDDNDDFGSHTSSRLSLAYVQDLGADSSIKYRASVGTGFRAPSLYEIAYNTGPFAFPPAAGLALTEESSQGYDVGIEYDAANAAPRSHVFRSGHRRRNLLRSRQLFRLLAVDGNQHVERYRDRGRHPARRTLGAASPTGRTTTRWTRSISRACAARRTSATWACGTAPRTSGSTSSLNYRVARDSIDVGGVALDDYEVLDLSLTYDAIGRLRVLWARAERDGRGLSGSRGLQHGRTVVLRGRAVALLTAQQSWGVTLGVPHNAHAGNPMGSSRCGVARR